MKTTFILFTLFIFQFNYAYTILGNGLTYPSDLVISYDNNFLYFTENGLNIKKMDLTSASYTITDVISMSDAATMAGSTNYFIQDLFYQQDGTLFFQMMTDSDSNSIVDTSTFLGIDDPSNFNYSTNTVYSVGGYNHLVKYYGSNTYLDNTPDLLSLVYDYSNASDYVILSEINGNTRHIDYNNVQQIMSANNFLYISENDPSYFVKQDGTFWIINPTMDPNMPTITQVANYNSFNTNSSSSRVTIGQSGNAYNIINYNSNTNNGEVTQYDLINNASNVVVSGLTNPLWAINKINDSNVVYISVAGSGPNNGAIIRSFVSTLNTEDIESENSKLKIGPNPVKDYLYLSSIKNIDKIEVFSIDGRLITNFSNLNSKKLDMSTLKSGNYIITVYKENGKKESIKFNKF